MNSRELLTKLESEMIALAKIKARESILEFTKYTKRDYYANWHHELLCKKLDQFINGDIKRLLIFMPPQHGKSELVSRRLPAYLLGKNPSLKIVEQSHYESFPGGMYESIQKGIRYNHNSQVKRIGILSSKFMKPL